MDNLNFKTGYYTVGDSVFEKKVLAVYHASQTNEKIKWTWNDNTMALFDWTKEPTLSLDELYKIRAQQIRDEYDYVLIFCSGGADSTNVLQSFLKNNIHVDEVVAGAPLSGLSSWDWNNADNAASNTISETQFAQLPLMEYVQKNFPKTKVTIHDYFVDMLNYKEDEWLLQSGDYIHPTFAARYNLQRDEYAYLRKLADSGKKIALVYGIDKPNLAKDDENLYMLFNDQLICNGVKSIDHNNIKVELFYWSPDAVPLLIKQGHLVSKWICRDENKNFLQHAVLSRTTHTGDLHFGRNVYERKIIPLIYSSLNYASFQCLKPTKPFMGEHDAWFPILHSDTSTRNMMVSDYKNLMDSVDGSFFWKNHFGEIGGFHKHYKYFKLGKISYFTEVK